MRDPALFRRGVRDLVQPGCGPMQQRGRQQVRVPVEATGEQVLAALLCTISPPVDLATELVEVHRLRHVPAPVRLRPAAVFASFLRFCLADTVMCSSAAVCFASRALGSTPAGQSDRVDTAAQRC